ncbi:flagellar motor switch protein FliN [Porphyrobacter algicida]|uniref:Flagellar motor switch protein FliN n=1 Tax=Qipengyuania algicida TaxID=1836209 RepID=A0A845AFR6_9SPHN|nr:flagellar motor switch protein FliN [Qipengyuania algicida]MXP27645.1 flagellar motor switch protein FliN [Qipengyuania algicida]
MIAGGNPFARINDIAVQLTVELGSARMSLREVMALAEDEVVVLDRLVDEPVDLLVNGTLVARGEVVSDKNRFGIRILDLVGQDHGQPSAPQAALAQEGVE